METATTKAGLAILNHPAIASKEAETQIRNTYRPTRLSSEKFAVEFGKTDIDPTAIDPQLKKIISTIGEISWLNKLKTELSTYLAKDFTTLKTRRKRRWSQELTDEVERLEKCVTLKNEELRAILLHIEPDQGSELYSFNRKGAESIYAAWLPS